MNGGRQGGREQKGGRRGRHTFKRPQQGTGCINYGSSV